MALSDLICIRCGTLGPINCCEKSHIITVGNLIESYADCCRHFDTQVDRACEAEKEVKAISSKLDAQQSRADIEQGRAAELQSRLDSQRASINSQTEEILQLRSRLDALSEAVKDAWSANREGDLWKTLSRAMDLVDPERNAPPVSAVETHEPKEGELADKLGWCE